MDWIDVPRTLPWLPTKRPYFVHRGNSSRLTADLMAAGFEIVTLSRPIDSERDLLSELGVVLDFADYYGPNWDAFNDLFHEYVVLAPKPTAIVWDHAERILEDHCQEAVRSIHLLLATMDSAAETKAPGAQTDLFVTGTGRVFTEVP